MAARQEAIIVPSILAWARKTARLSSNDAAKKLNVSEQRLASWEEGSARPTIKQLRNCANVYKRPLAVFYLAEPPTDFQPLKDFRSTQAPSEIQYSYALALAIREAHQKQEETLVLYEELEESPPDFNVSIDRTENEETAADRLRDRLGISLESQFSWKSAYEALRNWRSALEAAGVIVMQMTSVEVTEARGFSIYSPVLPVIVVNPKDTPTGRIFTLFHELAHLGLRTSATCDLHEGNGNRSEGTNTEIFCNQVAASAIMPIESVRNDDTVRAKSRPITWTDHEIQQLARKWWISKEAVLRRLLSMNLTSKIFYQMKREEYIGYYYMLNKVSGFIWQYQKPIVRYGDSFVRLALEAFHTERITASELSGLLNMKLDHLTDLENELSRRLA